MDLMGLPMNPDDHSNRIKVGNNLMEAVHARVTFHAAGRSFLVGIENTSDQDTGETATYYLF